MKLYKQGESFKKGYGYITYGKAHKRHKVKRTCRDKNYKLKGRLSQIYDT